MYADLVWDSRIHETTDRVIDTTYRELTQYLRGVPKLIDKLLNYKLGMPKLLSIIKIPYQYFIMGGATY